MVFNLQFPTQDPEVSQLQLKAGEILFVLGANGTGKSSLMWHISQQNIEVTRKISAHRQTWMNSDVSDMAPAARMGIEGSIQRADYDQQSRYRDLYAEARISMTIYDIINKENSRARSITRSVETGKPAEAACKAEKEESPIAVINELFRHSNIPIEISIHEDGRVMASRGEGTAYSVAKLSDGERNALLIAGNILTAPPGTLFIIDEPERHLHRSIISPLLSQLFKKRRDCGFVVSTHDHELPLQIRGARALLLRSCSFSGENVAAWDADLLPASDAIDETLKRDLLGARRKLLFVEGNESSLDKPLYSLIFPMVSVIPKGSCHDVERAVAGGRAAEQFHWLRAFGIVDGDGYESDEIRSKRERGIYAVPFYSVEAIYFHPKIIGWIAERQSDVHGGCASELTNNALKEGVAAICNQTERLSIKVVKKLVRKWIIGEIPNDNDLITGQKIEIENPAKEILTDRKCELDRAVKDDDWEAILKKCPVRESNALNTIWKTLRFASIDAYEGAVFHLLSTDDDALALVRGLFEGLFDELQGRTVCTGAP